MTELDKCSKCGKLVLESEYQCPWCGANQVSHLRTQLAAATMRLSTAKARIARLEARCEGWTEVLHIATERIDELKAICQAQKRAER